MQDSYFSPVTALSNLATFKICNFFHYIISNITLHLTKVNIFYDIFEL